MTNHFFRLRFTYLLTSYPKRWKRLLSHLFFQDFVYRIPLDKWYDWPMDILFYVIDVFAISDIADVLLNGFKSMRRLSKAELVVANDIFDKNIEVEQVFIWEKARPIKKGLYHAFVSFNTVQSIKPLSLPVLIHELVHVWQFQRFGSVYIYRALKAQNSEMGYDYGGCNHLIACLASDTNLLTFNFEQQAEIVEDYVRIQYNKGVPHKELAVYQSFVNELNYQSEIG